MPVSALRYCLLVNMPCEPKRLFLNLQCRARLEERQQVIAEDVKADKSFYGACKEDIKANKCVKQRQTAEGDDEDYSRSSILLCLEAAQSQSKYCAFPRFIPQLYGGLLVCGYQRLKGGWPEGR